MTGELIDQQPTVATVMHIFPVNGPESLWGRM